MIFSPELAEKVLNGEKTVTRRPVKTDECRYKVGRDYAVQNRRGGWELGRVKIMSVEQQRLGQITSLDAMKEGFDGKAGFYLYWGHLYGHPIDFGTPVWRISFELIVREQ